MTGERILVVGGGFLGRALARVLSARDHHVTILSPNPASPGHTGAPESVVVRGRQEDESLVSGLLAEHTTVIHAAWGTTPGSSADRLEIETAAGLAPWLAFLAVLQRFPSVRLLFLSSGGTIYGNPERLPVAEDAPLRPLSYHGAAKAAAEIFLGAQARPHTRKPIILRPSNVYGPGQAPQDGFGVLPHLLRCAAGGAPFTLWGDGAQVRDYLYVEDFADAVARLTEHPEISGTFNVGSGQGTSLRELIGLVERVTGRRINVESRPARQGDVARVVLDVGRIYRAIGWKADTPMPEGIARAWQWLTHNL